MSRGLAVFGGAFLEGSLWFVVAGGTLELIKALGWLKLSFADEPLAPAATMWLGTPVGAVIGGALGYQVSDPSAPPCRTVKAFLVMIVIPALAMLFTLYRAGTLGRSQLPVSSSLPVRCCRIRKARSNDDSPAIGLQESIAARRSKMIRPPAATTNAVT